VQLASPIPDDSGMDIQNVKLVGDVLSAASVKTTSRCGYFIDVNLRKIFTNVSKLIS